MASFGGGGGGEDEGVTEEQVIRGEAPTRFRWPTPKKDEKAGEGVDKSIYDAAYAQDLVTLCALSREWAGNEVLDMYEEMGTGNSLSICVRRGWEEGVRVLVAAYSMVPTREKSDPLLCLAAMCNNEYLCRHLIENGFKASEVALLQYVKYVGANSNDKIMALLEAAAAEDEAAAAEEKARSVAEMALFLERAESLFPIGLIESTTTSVADIEAICSAAQVPFVDTSFPPSPASLFYKPGKPVEGSPYLYAMHMDGMWNGLKCEASFDEPLEWKRPYSADGTDTDKSSNKEQWALFKENIEPADIKQGGVGDCWFMCSVACLAEFPELVRDLFPLQSEASAWGVYQIRLYINGLPRTYLIDDLLPHYPGGGPIYAQGHGKELWVMLLEKAYAKAYGSYHQIVAGFPIYAISDLTGAPYKTFRFDDKKVQTTIASGALFDYLIDCTEKGYLMNTGTRLPWGRKMGDVVDGLVICHAYSVIKVVRTRSGDHELCQLRNPWGQFEWTGDWSDASALWTPELKDECQLKAENDGLFWMSFKDFCKHFSDVSVSLVRHSLRHSLLWQEYREAFFYDIDSSGTVPLSSTHLFCFEIDVECEEIYITIHQQDKRCLTAPQTYIDIGVALLRRGEDGISCTLVGSVDCSSAHNVQLEVKHLAPGSYVIHPVAFSTKGSTRREAAISVHSSIELFLRHQDEQSMGAAAFNAINHVKVKPLPVLKKDVEAPTDVAKIIFNAARNNMLESLTDLCTEWSGNPVIDAHTEEGGLTGLCRAVVNGCEPAVLTLISAGANVNHADSYGRTPLHFAVHYDRDRICKILVDHGGNAMAANIQGETPLSASSVASSSWSFFTSNNSKAKCKAILEASIAAGATAAEKA